MSWNRNLACADKGQLIRIMRPPFVHQTGLAMHEQAEPRPGLVPTKADGRAAFGLRREVGWLAPFQGFSEPTGFGQACCGFQNERAQVNQMRTRRWRAGVQDSGHVWWRGGQCGDHRQERSPFLRRFALSTVKKTSRIRF